MSILYLNDFYKVSYDFEVPSMLNHVVNIVNEILAFQDPRLQDQLHILLGTQPQDTIFMGIETSVKALKRRLRI